MSGFAHDIAGGNGSLVVAQVQSPNYVHGVSGWIIRKDGTAEFHDIEIPAGSGGATVYFASTAPAHPNVGDLWYDTANGLALSQWNGSAWVAYQIGTGAIGPGSITASLIAANTITAAQLAAGIVYAGIVDATTITGATIIADGSSGEILVYSGAPATGNLIGSWSAAAGTDGHSNSYPAGLSVTNGSGIGVQLNGTTLHLIGIGGSSTGFLDSQAAASNSTRPQTLLSGASNNNGVPQILLAGESQDGTSLPVIILQGFSLSGGVPQAITAQINGGMVATQPGTTTPETWHAVTVPSGMTGTIRVKVLTEGNFAALDVNVTITSTSATATGFATGALPSASYYPATATQQSLAVQKAFTTVSNASPRVSIPTSGALSLNMPGFATAGATCLVWGTIIYPLD